MESDRPRDTDLTRKLVTAWYHFRAQVKFRERVLECATRFPDPAQFRPAGLTVRDLRLRWASMSPAARLMVNRRLVQAPLDAIDYVITHELCHLQEPHHGAAFFDLLERVMPDWEKRNLRLEHAMSWRSAGRRVMSRNLIRRWERKPAGFMPGSRVCRVMIISPLRT